MKLFSRLRRSVRGALAQTASRPADIAPAAPSPLKAAMTCPACGLELQPDVLERLLFVCPCGKHLRISVRRRLLDLCDTDSFRELASEVVSVDPLAFPGYGDKLAKAGKTSDESEGVLCGIGRIGGIDCALFAMEASYMMGSMGSAVGERITRLFEYATDRRLPVIGFTASGGARMQEGVLSLMQMAKVSGAVQRHGEAGGLYIAVLTDPTTGGITASFAMEGDIILAEPGALIGFAGRRVVEQTTGSALPKDFQSAEFNLAHGFIDAIVKRTEMRATLEKLLRLNGQKAS